VTLSDSGYAFAMFDSTTLTKLANLPADAYPESVGVSPDGTLVGTTEFGGSQPDTTSSFWFYSPTTASLLRTSAQPGGWGSFSETKAGVAFNASGTVAYTLASTYDQGYYLIASVVAAPQANAVSVAVTSPSRYGLPTRFQITGTPSSTARLTVHDNGSGHDTTLTVTLGASGVATVWGALHYSGTVRATVDGDLTHAGFASATSSFRVPSRLTVTMSRPSKVSNHVYIYAKAPNARQLVNLAGPVYRRAVVVVLYQKKPGRAWSRHQTLTVHTDQYGRAFTYMRSMARGLVYRVAYRFAGDSFNGPSSGVTQMFRLA
jgi:hypothetical protein